MPLAVVSAPENALRPDAGLLALIGRAGPGDELLLRRPTGCVRDPAPLDSQAAEMDGCGKGRIFFRIILPQITPALITAAIFSFYWAWEDLLTPLMYLNAPDLYTISLALRSFADPSAATDWGAIFAMSSLSLVPVFVIFILFQRYLVEGISTTGLKG